MENLHLASRTDFLKPSPTLGITAKANAMKASGMDVVSLAAGEPDFNTPEPICRAAIEALNAGFTKYTPTTGIKELKEAIVEKLQRDNGLSYSPDQIVVSCGAKHSLYNSIMTLIDPGDEVILFAPYWMTYAEQVMLAGGVPVVVMTDESDAFVPRPEAIREKITAKTKAILFNSPCNPTGAVFPRATLEAMAKIAIEHRLWLIADEIYEQLVYDAEHISIGSLSPEVLAQTITINGCSKTYSMTGWRVGFSASPLAPAKAIGSFQDQVTSNPTSFAQRGAVEAFKMDPASVGAMRDDFKTRRDLIVSLVNQIPNVSISAPQGAFYVMPSVEAYLKGEVKSDLELTGYLLEKAQVAVIPGSVFQGVGKIRMSYAANPENIRRGMERIAEALAGLA